MGHTIGQRATCLLHIATWPRCVRAVFACLRSTATRALVGGILYRRQCSGVRMGQRAIGVNDGTLKQHASRDTKPGAWHLQQAAYRALLFRDAKRDRHRCQRSQHGVSTDSHMLSACGCGCGCGCGCVAFCRTVSAWPPCCWPCWPCRRASMRCGAAASVTEITTDPAPTACTCTQPLLPRLPWL